MISSEVLNGKAKCKLGGKDYHLKKGLTADKFEF